MNEQKIEVQGIYAGLSPADFAMRIRRRPLGEKLKASPGLARGERGTAPDKSHSVTA
jgi:hypothetical protein